MFTTKLLSCNRGCSGVAAVRQAQHRRLHSPPCCSQCRKRGNGADVPYSCKRRCCRDPSNVSADSNISDCHKIWSVNHAPYRTFCSHQRTLLPCPPSPCENSRKHLCQSAARRYLSACPACPYLQLVTSSFWVKAIAARFANASAPHAPFASLPDSSAE